MPPRRLIGRERERVPLLRAIRNDEQRSVELFLFSLRHAFTEEAAECQRGQGTVVGQAKLAGADTEMEKSRRRDVRGVGRAKGLERAWDGL